MSTKAQKKKEPLPTIMGVGSVGLAAPMTIAPGRFLATIGVKEDATTLAIVRAVGAQECGAAAGIFAIERPRPVVTMWSRFAADLLHLGLLGAAYGSKRNKDSKRMIGAMAYVGQCAVADLAGALRLQRNPERTMDTGVDFKVATTVRASREDVYTLWRDFEYLPAFMFHLDSVKTTGERRSHWKAKGPAGTSVEWDAEITEDRPNELIAWRSVDRATIENSGTVRFVDAPRDQGTEIHLEMHVAVPGGKIGALVGKVFGEEPQAQAKDDLRRFKQVLEAGEVVRSDGTPEGQTSLRLIKQRPAQPPEESVNDATAPVAGTGAEGGTP